MTSLPTTATNSGDDSSSMTIGHGTENILDHTVDQLEHVQPESWPLGPVRVQSAPTPNNTEATSTETRSSSEDAPPRDAAEVSAASGQIEHENDGPRSSFEIMGCLAPSTNQVQVVPGVGPTLSRPPSSMPDFGFVSSEAALTPEIPMGLQPQGSMNSRDEEQNDGSRPYILFIVSLFLVGVSLMSITATGAVTTVFNQMGKPVAEGYTAVLIFSIVVFVFSAAALGHALYGPPRVHAGISRRLRAFVSPMRWPRLHLRRLHWPRLRWLRLRWPVIKMRRPAQPDGQPPTYLPHPKEFELHNLDSGPPRPPTPYPGPARPAPPITSAQNSPQERLQTLPLGFPVPPASGVRRMNSAVSGMSNVSFRSDPRSVSPLSSDAPPTPPPKDPAFSRFQSREPLLPPVATGNTVIESDTRASILTTLCDAVQQSNPASEPGHAVQNYSPLAMASSPATGTASRDSASIQPPKPAYQIELASPSRGKGKENEN